MKSTCQVVLAPAVASDEDEAISLAAPCARWGEYLDCFVWCIVWCTSQ